MGVLSNSRKVEQVLFMEVSPVFASFSDRVCERVSFRRCIQPGVAYSKSISKIHYAQKINLSDLELMSTRRLKYDSTLCISDRSHMYNT